MVETVFDGSPGGLKWVARGDASFRARGHRVVQVRRSFQGGPHEPCRASTRHFEWRSPTMRALGQGTDLLVRQIALSLRAPLVAFGRHWKGASPPPVPPD